jgi:hypothetical protein
VTLVEVLLRDVKDVVHQRLPLAANLSGHRPVGRKVPRVAECLPPTVVLKMLLVGVKEPDGIVTDEGDKICN